MTARPKILVTSAAGKTGLPTALQLLEKGFPVRAFVRSDDARAARLRGAGAEIFIGNQYALSHMRRAMQGIRRAYHCPPTAPNGLHFSAVFAVAAHDARLEHVVTLGQWLSSVDHPSLFTREVHVSERLLDALPDTTHTIVNPGWFADNYLMVLPLAAQLGILAMPLGDGSVKKNAPPANEDIASVAAEALADPAQHAGQTYRPTGPELLSPDEIAVAFSKGLKRSVRYMAMSERMFLKAMKAVPPPNYSDAALTQLRLYAEEYRRGTFAVNAPTDVVRAIGGREPERMDSIVRRAAQAADVRQSLGRQLGALSDLVRIALTKAPDPSRISTAKDHVELSEPVFAQDCNAWRDSHENDRECNRIRRIA
ncbi:NmrA family NAD(P)-binding protein [Oricola sp.]|uniref:NmrA family NAD(P)-binding protein n=1 Tax=Oricola sp. TaxID=1979950 RepID=UPI003BA8C567